MLSPPFDMLTAQRALVAATRAATGLGQNHVVFLNGFDPVQQRPQRPFSTLQIQSSSIRHGGIASEDAGLYGDDAGKFAYVAQRSMVVSFNFYADTPDEAHSLAHLLQFGMDLRPIQDLVSQGGLSVWRASDVLDLTTPLATGYEGRAQLTVTMGYIARAVIDVGVIEHVPVAGEARDELTTVETFNLTADI